MEEKEMRDRLVQLCVKAYMFGGEQVIIDLPSLIGFVEEELDKAREEKIQNIFTREECVIVEPRYISDWSDKYNKHFKCNRCKSKCLIPVIEPLVVICPKCGELDLDEIS